MALPLGRGAFTLGTLRPLPTQPVTVPPLNLAGQLPEQHNATITINWDLAVAAPAGGAMADFTAWPEFHNGAAAGLRLQPEAGRLGRSWIMYNRPQQPQYSHAGLLLALGLRGHLSCLTAADMYRYGALVLACDWLQFEYLVVLCSCGDVMCCLRTCYANHTCQSTCNRL